MTLGITTLSTRAQHCFAECHIACLYAECRYAECRYAECRYAEDRVAIVLLLPLGGNVGWIRTLDHRISYQLFTSAAQARLLV